MKLRQNNNQFEVKIYEMEQAMEEINEGWIEVMITNENEPKELNSKKKLLKAQLDKIGVVMGTH